MAIPTITFEHLDYLQHLENELVPLPVPLRWPAVPREQRKEFQIDAVGRFKQPAKAPNGREESTRYELEDFIISLVGQNTPLAFEIEGFDSRVQVRVGSWGKEATGVLRAAVVKSALSAQFPLLEMQSVEKQNFRFESGGVALGLPSILPGKETELPIDRIVRGMRGFRWKVSVLAEPVNLSVPSLIRARAIEESRRVQALAKAEAAPSPLVESYVELLKAIIKQSTLGLSIGMWRSATYLLADAAGYRALAGLWRGLFSGDDSLPEPLLVRKVNAAPELADGWILPDLPARPGPGGEHGFQRLLEYQSLLTSRHLARLVQFPLIDTPGFGVRSLSRYDAAKSAVRSTGKSIRLGQILTTRLHDAGAEGSTPNAGPEYAVEIDSLTKHAFVAGVTGVGKTNSVMQILTGVMKHDRKFLVIEPAKTEYRSLLNDPQIAPKLRIYTLGNVGVAPFVINPFEPEPGTPVGIHMDLLRSVFSASFGMWTPLPQILERCMQALYAESGWDIVTGENHRLNPGESDPNAWPTLTDLAAKVEEIIPSLGYDEKVASDMRAALLTRITGLSRGAKGRMLDSRESDSFSDLLDNNVVFELEGIADDDEKAFFMGLILVRLFENRRLQTKSRSLRHLLVVEEAHRLLSNVAAKASEESSNPRGKAVETFANLLSEVRAYGQGVLVADQVPVKLAPDVIKNTNLKIIHRTVAGDDRHLLASAMAMDESQERGLAILTTGQAAVFSEGEDAPILVAMEKMPAAVLEVWPSDQQVKAHMLKFRGHDAGGSGSVPTHGSQRDLTSSNLSRDRAKKILEDGNFRRDFSRAVLSLTVEPDSLARLWPGVISRGRRWLPHHEPNDAAFDEALVLEASHWLAQRKGRQLEWSYPETSEYERRLREAILSFHHLDGEHTDAGSAAKTFQRTAMQLHRREMEPFPGCDRVCPKSECLYKQSIDDYLLRKPGAQAAWRSSEDQDDLEESLWNSAAKQITEVEGTNNVDSKNRAVLCLIQHYLEIELPETHRNLLDVFLKLRDKPTTEEEQP